MLSNDGELIYQGTETKKSNKTGREFTLLYVADPAKYERYEFFVTSDFVDAGVMGKPCKVELDLSRNGFNQNLTCKSVTVVS
ncbi:hypothetical protein [Enterococcus sp. BWR-S5]|uniref:hypothetical protein n=1 Tax=Enterococcus sp. BWR-S5 TaxID=2787714 RepID=UPI001922286D|nr:hypothetical protein [Enterococcus sp. BWR-S5]MBL1224576.1 hypothetical protein [Enterococcus sp. BWR-S5]MBL1224587.1 hypothetical protein [Enterococcus sp. BWR-S5]